jgi:hypothetical protein
MGNTETPLSDPGGNLVADSTYSGIYPDGSQMLTRSGTLLTLPGGTLAPTQPSGLPADPGDMPAFSPDGTLVAFNSGVGLAAHRDELQQHVQARSLARLPWSTTATSRPHPCLAGVLPRQQVDRLPPPEQPRHRRRGRRPLHARGRAGADPLDQPRRRRERHPLDNLNGKGYLPKLAVASTLTCTADGNSVGGIDADHADDVDHNYEPTVNPVGSGGYAWVVFTSRRMYGSGHIPPFCSDPRGVDLATEHHPEEALGRRGRPHAGPGQGRQPPRLLPARAGAARRQLARLLGPRPLPGRRRELHDRRPVLQRLLRANGDGGALVCSNAPPTEPPCVTTLAASSRRSSAWPPPP